MYKLLLLIASCLVCAGCGRPDYCDQGGAQSMDAWRASSWAPYCTKLYERTQAPLDYDLPSTPDRDTTNPFDIDREDLADADAKQRETAAG